MWSCSLRFGREPNCLCLRSRHARTLRLKKCTTPATLTFMYLGVLASSSQSGACLKDSKRNLHISQVCHLLHFITDSAFGDDIVFGSLLCATMSFQSQFCSLGVVELAVLQVPHRLPQVILTLAVDDDKPVSNLEPTLAIRFPAVFSANSPHQGLHCLTRMPHEPKCRRRRGACSQGISSGGCTSTGNFMVGKKAIMLVFSSSSSLFASYMSCSV